MFQMQTLELSFLCFGTASFLLSFWASSQLSAVPKESRLYQDQLPIGFLCLWPGIRALVYFFGQSTPRQRRLSAHTKLCQGGADYVVSAEQYIFSHVAAGVAMALVALGIQALFALESLIIPLMFGLLGGTLPTSWLRRRIAQREKEVLKLLPTYLDILTLAMESGLNFVGALTLAVEKSQHSVLRQEFARVLRDVKAGKTKTFALNGLRYRIKLEAINSLVSSLLQSDKTGAPLGKVLRSQADQRRFERFARAEKLGMEAPVKLLGPLVTFIFPTTFIILMFLITVKVVGTGMISGGIMDILMTNPVTFFSSILGYG